MDLLGSIIGNKTLVGVVIGKLKGFMEKNKMDVFMIRRDDNDPKSTDGIVVSAFSGEVLIVTGKEDIEFVRRCFADRADDLKYSQSVGEGAK